MSDGQNKLHIDSDWKSQAQAEKQRLAEEAKKKEAAAAASASAKSQAAGAGAASKKISAAGRQLPPADFRTLISTMVTQAMFAMGMIPDPQTGRRMASLDMARHHIDMLSVIETKTKGNLDEEETKLLTSALYELRMQYVQISQQMIAEQMGAGQK